VPSLIRFIGDPSNIYFPKFEITNEKTITKNGGNKDIIFHHTKSLPQKGVFYFRVKIIKTKQNDIHVGICGKTIKDKAGADWK
jgi:hypothetical protein